VGDSGDWQENESGIFVKVQDDLKRIVVLTGVVYGAVVKIRTHHETVREAMEWVDQSRKTAPGDLHYSTHPIYGTEQIHTTEVLASIIEAGYEWVDIEAQEIQDVLRRQQNMELTAQIGGGNRKVRRAHLQ
jgi:hypothetical protein